MYYYGNNSGGCGNYSYQTPTYQNYYPMNYCCGGNNNSSSYAIILVLFILLVVIIGCRWGN